MRRPTRCCKRVGGKEGDDMNEAVTAVQLIPKEPRARWWKVGTPTVRSAAKQLSLRQYSINVFNVTVSP